MSAKIWDVKPRSNQRELNPTHFEIISIKRWKMFIEDKFNFRIIYLYLFHSHVRCILEHKYKNMSQFHTDTFLRSYMDSINSHPYLHNEMKYVKFSYRSASLRWLLILATAINETGNEITRPTVRPPSDMSNKFHKSRK